MIWFFLIVIALLVVPLFLPVELEINSEEGIYRVRWKGGFGIRAFPDEHGWHWYYSIFFYEKEWHPSKKPPKPKPKKKSKKKKSFLSPRKMWLLFKKCFKAFRFKRFFINWDTNDYITNAYFYPLTHFINKHRRFFQVNFSGKQEVDMLLQVRPIDLLLAFLAVIIFH